MRVEKIPIGEIVNAHGIHGDVRVRLRNSPPGLLNAFRIFYVDGVPMTPESIRMHKGMALVKFSGVDTMDAALSLRDKTVSVTRADAELPPDYVFDDELIGLRVYTADGTCLGELIRVDPYPAHNLYTVRGEKTYLIPAVRDVFIRSIDLDANRMEVNLWEGLEVDGN